MTTPHPGTREYRNQIVRLADLTVLDPLLADLRFEGCQIIGPAVLALLEDVLMDGCQFDVPDADALIWRIPVDRPRFTGAIGVARVEFFSCRFQGIGLAIPEQAYDEFAAGFNLPTQ